MANIAAYFQKAMLDWGLGGAAATQPTSRLLALSTAAPTSVAALEHPPLSGYTRATALFSAAASPAGSASNTAGMTFGPFSNSTAIIGAVLFDTTAVTAGNMLWYGTLLTARTVLPGDTLTIAPGALLITLS
jgi:hypothetical protein